METATGPRQYQDAKREQTSLLAPIEKRVLLWCAQRMPGPVNSDHLTALGFIGMLAAGFSYAMARSSRYWVLAAIVAIFLNWFGDSLDGTLARVRNRQRPRYGFYIDHILDAFSTCFLLGGLALSPYMTSWVAVTLLVLFLLLSIQSYLAAHSLGTFQLSFWKFSPTELRVLLIIGNTALFLRGPIARLAGYEFLLFDVGGVIGMIGMAAMLIAATVRNTLALYRAERL